MMRRRMDSGLDTGVPSTSGRTPSSSSSSSSSRSSSRGHPYSQNQLPNGYNLEDSWDLTDDSGYTPFPLNLPAGSGGMGGNASAHGMDLWSGGAPALGLHDSREAWSKLGQVCAHASLLALVGPPLHAAHVQESWFGVVRTMHISHRSFGSLLEDKKGLVSAKIGKGFGCWLAAGCIEVHASSDQHS